MIHRGHSGVHAGVADDVYICGTQAVWLGGERCHTTQPCNTCAQLYGCQAAAHVRPHLRLSRLDVALGHQCFCCSVHPVVGPTAPVGILMPMCTVMLRASHALSAHAGYIVFCASGRGWVCEACCWTRVLMTPALLFWETISSPWVLNSMDGTACVQDGYVAQGVSAVVTGCSCTDYISHVWPWPVCRSRVCACCRSPLYSAAVECWCCTQRWLSSLSVLRCRCCSIAHTASWLAWLLTWDVCLYGVVVVQCVRKLSILGLLQALSAVWACSAFTCSRSVDHNSSLLR